MICKLITVRELDNSRTLSFNVVFSVSYERVKKNFSEAEIELTIVFSQVSAHEPLELDARFYDQRVVEDHSLEVLCLPGRLHVVAGVVKLASAHVTTRTLKSVRCHLHLWPVFVIYSVSYLEETAAQGHHFYLR